MSDDVPTKTVMVEDNTRQTIITAILLPPTVYLLFFAATSEGQMLAVGGAALLTGAVLSALFGYREEEVVDYEAEVQIADNSPITLRQAEEWYVKGHITYEEFDDAVADAAAEVGT